MLKYWETNGVNDDSGATGNGYKEKDLVLKMGLNLEQKFKNRLQNVKFILTRRDDRFIPLGERSKIADNANADYFLSIHFNSAGVNTAQGVEVFAYPSSSSGQRTAKIINDRIVRKGLALKNRGVKGGNFSVLRRTKATSNLLETCFINNREDINNFINNYDEYMEELFLAVCEVIGMNPSESDTRPTETPQNKPTSKPSNFAWGKGDKGETVKDIQRTLKDLGYDIGNAGVDGIFGERTDKAVRKFQKDNNLNVDGLVGENTLKLLSKPKENEEIRPSKPNDKLEVGKLNIRLIGELVATDGFIENGISYVTVNDIHLELREIFEAMTLDVTWENDLKIIEINTSGKFVKQDGLTDILVLGSKINVKTFIHQDKHCLRIRNAYVPVRDIFEQLGFKVSFNNELKAIEITK